MRKRIEVGVLGATGMVGQQFINQLAGHPWFELAWLAASERSEGKRYADAAPWRLDTEVPEGIADRTVEPATPGVGPRLVFSALDAASPASWSGPSRTRDTSWSATRGTTAWTRRCRCSCRR